MQTIVGGLLTHYRRSGQGKPIVLVHGWGDSLMTFQAIVQSLSAQYDVISLDLPGFGKTDPPKDAWNLTRYAEFLREFLIKLDIKPYAIIGHSNGGALSIHATARGFVQPEKLVLLAPSGVRNTQHIKRLLIKLIAKTGKIATVWLPKTTRARLQKKLYGTIRSDMLVAPHLQETFKQTVRQDIQADATQLQLPTMLIYGDQDTATPLDPIGRRLQQLIPRARLEIIIGADHFVHQAEPAQVAAHIQEFLGS